MTRRYAHLIAVVMLVAGCSAPTNDQPNLTVDEWRARAEQGDADAQLTGEQRETAVEYRDLVANVMTPAQIAEAQRLAREWDAALKK